MDADEDTPSGVISQYLVTFDSIAELQQRNAELLQVVRKLSREQQELYSIGIADGQLDEAGVPMIENGPFFCFTHFVSNLLFYLYF